MSTTSSTFVATDGEGYERLMGRWSRLLALPFLDFTGTADGDRILDVGCGTGHLAFAVARRTGAGEVRGVDLAQPYIEHARRHNEDARIAFEVADACALPYPAQSFDRVLSLLVLHFVPEPGKAIAEMRRVAKPGAVVGAAVWDARGGWVANRMFFDTAAMLDPEAGVLVTRASHGLESEFARGARARLGEGIAGGVAARNEALKLGAKPPNAEMAKPYTKERTITAAISVMR